MISDALHQFLSGNSGMKALLGTPLTRSDSTTGIFPSEAPDEPTMPYIVFSQVGSLPLSETFTGTGSLLSERWRFACHGTTARNAKALAKTLLRLMVSFQGEQIVNSVKVAEVSGVWLRFEGDTTEAMPHGSLFTSHVDVEIVYTDLGD